MDGRTRKCGRKCGDRRDVPCFFLHTSNPQKTCRAGNVGTDGTFPSFCDQNGCLVSEIGERPVCPQVFRFPRFSPGFPEPKDAFSPLRFFVLPQ